MSRLKNRWNLFLPVLKNLVFLVVVSAAFLTFIKRRRDLSRAKQARERDGEGKKQ